MSIKVVSKLKTHMRHISLNSIQELEVRFKSFLRFQTNVRFKNKLALIDAKLQKQFLQRLSAKSNETWFLRRVLSFV